jgi:enamine deaminase RidA (YjgF/YER057c/UK114 family)
LRSSFAEAESQRDYEAVAQRVYVPFDDAWAMQVEPRVSQAVRVGGFGATCGQCDLDARGRPLHAGELWPQVEAVARHLRRRLEQAGASPRQVRRLEAFYVGPVDEDELAAALCEAVGGEPDVLLVPIPYFYYPGMRIELDAIFDDSERLLFRTVDGEDVASALSTLALPPESLLALRIYYSCDSTPPSVAGAATTSVPLPTLPCRVRVAAVAAEERPRDLIFVGGQLPVDEQGVVLYAGDVEAQTRLVMGRLEAELECSGATFADLVKVNVHYVGGPRPEDLHRNLAVRSRFYAPPGPASTGVPVPCLQLPGASILVEAVAAR